jgi:hypothetical protein
MQNPKNNTTSHSETQLNHYLGLALILISSLLVGIWAVKDTIALRNILLIAGAFGSIILFYQNKSSMVFGGLNKYWIPIICIGLVFCWVIFHYFFLSISREIQLKELTSTWLRCALAVILGLGASMTLARYPRYIILSWMAILISFCVLFAQYLPLAWESGKLIVPLEVEDFTRYIYIGKINATFLGVLLIAGATGFLLDTVISGGLRWIKRAGFFWIISLFFAFYSFAFIINSRSGIFFGALITVSWIIYSFTYFFYSHDSLLSLKPSIRLKLTLIVMVVLVMVAGFTRQQIQRDNGWHQLAEDIKIGYQVDQYPNWQNIEMFGFPKTESGKVVTYNTYERVAWATAGIKSIPHHPFGVGILIRPLGLAGKELFPAVTSISTHSGWVDLALSFGLPIVCLMWTANLTILYFAIRQKSPFKCSFITLSAVLFAMFIVGELSNGHTLEMLFYFLSMMSGIQITQGSKLEEKKIPSALGMGTA